MQKVAHEVQQHAVDQIAGGAGDHQGERHPLQPGAAADFFDQIPAHHRNGGDGNQREEDLSSRQHACRAG